MDVFALRDSLIEDYRRYVSSFIAVRDERIKQVVEETLGEGRYWPDPLIQLNPAFAPGGTVSDLVTEGLLHPRASEIFRVKDTGQPMMLYQHQSEAIRLAREGHNYVVTTGTGSGKSLTYIIPIVDHI